MARSAGTCPRSVEQIGVPVTALKYRGRYERLYSELPREHVGCGVALLHRDEPGLLSNDDAKFSRELSRAEQIWAKRMAKCRN